MNKVAQCMAKAAQLRAQAAKLEKVALLLDDSDKVTGADLGIGAGALGLLGGGAYGVNKYMKHRRAAAAQAALVDLANQQAAQAIQAANSNPLMKGALRLSETLAGRRLSETLAGRVTNPIQDNRLLKDALGLF